MGLSPRSLAMRRRKGKLGQQQAQAEPVPHVKPHTKPSATATATAVTAAATAPPHGDSSAEAAAALQLRKERLHALRAGLVAPQHFDARPHL